MATRNIDLLNDVVLKNDIYKNNTLLIKKGNVLNAYLLQKLNNFGISDYEENFTVESSENKEVLILQEDMFKCRRTMDILTFAGFKQGKIVVTSSQTEFFNKLKFKSLKYIFLDYSFYAKDLLDEIFLNTYTSKLIIFVMNSPEITAEKLYNTDYQNVKFLYRPLANSYIKALLRLYS